MAAWSSVGINEREALISIVRLFDDQRFSECAAEIGKLAGSDFGQAGYFDRLASAVKSQQWNLLDADFDEGRFVGTKGHCLILGPYSRGRRRRRETRLSGMAGICLFDESELDLSKISSKLFGRAPHPTNRILGVVHFSSAGLIGGTYGEAFVVPGGWAFGQSESGPAINLLLEQYHRMTEGMRRLLDLFEANFHDWLSRHATGLPHGIVRRNQEFQFHENGHAIGVGFRRKVESGFFDKFENCGVEEWRSDGVSFRLAFEYGGPDVADSVAAACIALRFGVDARRQGGVGRDHDALAAALMLSDMLESGAVHIGNGGKLVFSNRGAGTLFDVVSAQAEKAVALTNRENNLVSERLDELYASVRPTDVAAQIVNRLGELQ